MGRAPTIDEGDLQNFGGPSNTNYQPSPLVQRVLKEEKSLIPESNLLLQPLVMHFTAVIQVILYV